MDKAWAGVDAGKEFHWAHCWTLRAESCSLRKVQNDEADISRLIEKALSFAEEVVWAVDQPGGGAALLLALLWERNQRVLNVPGLSVDGAHDVYPVGSLKPMPAMRTSSPTPGADEVGPQPT
ncbi:MAG TPA: transposase [Rubrobacter sp.]|jgi:hypothetical protein|nr:transposase [Rubrobacter sp.]